MYKSQDYIKCESNTIIPSNDTNLFVYLFIFVGEKGKILSSRMMRC